MPAAQLLDVPLVREKEDELAPSDHLFGQQPRLLDVPLVSEVEEQLAQLEHTCFASCPES